MAIDEPKAHLSVPEASAYLGVGRSTLYTLFSDGQLPYCKVGSRTVIKRTDLDEYMESVRVDRRGRWGR